MMRIKMIFNSKSERETEEIAKKIADSLGDCNLVCLYGDLGAGKTTFTKLFGKALGIKQRIVSPTFTIIRKHRLKDRNFYHIDAYRLKSSENNLEIKEILEEDNAIIVIEWAERIENILPKDRINIYFTYINENERNIRFEKPSR